MQHVVDRPRDLERIRDVLEDELEVAALEQVGDVLALAGDQVVDRDDRHPLREEALAEVGSEESGAAGDQRSLHAPVPIPDDGAADGVVDEALGGDPLRLVEVAQVDHQRRREPRLELREVEGAELIPLGRDDDPVGALGGLVGVRAEGDRRQERLRRGHRRGVEGADRRAAFDEALDDRDRRRLAHVVGVALEGQAEHGDGLAGERPEGLSRSCRSCGA